MSIFKKTEETTRNVKFNCSEVYVLTTTITSSYEDSTKSITLYFLSTKRGDEYYELFSDTKLEKKYDTDLSKCNKEFYKPYIEKVEPLRVYMLDKNKKKIKSEVLFEFITAMNVTNIIYSYSE